MMPGGFLRNVVYQTASCLTDYKKRNPRLLRLPPERWPAGNFYTIEDSSGRGRERAPVRVGSHVGHFDARMSSSYSLRFPTPDQELGCAGDSMRTGITYVGILPDGYRGRVLQPAREQS